MKNILVIGAGWGAIDPSENTCVTMQKWKIGSSVSANQEIAHLSAGFCSSLRRCTLLKGSAGDTAFIQPLISRRRFSDIYGACFHAY
jgi:hypothetical protein